VQLHFHCIEYSVYCDAEVGKELKKMMAEVEAVGSGISQELRTQVRLPLVE
jgi:hypothetical protein